MKEYYLVTDATAEQVARRTGLEAKDTHLGALVEKPKPFNLDAALDKLDRAMHTRCGCGSYAIMRSPSCPLAYAGVT